MAKSKELVNKIFGLLPPLFNFEDAIDLTGEADLNLNQLMANSAQQSQPAQEIATGGGAAETIGSVRSTLRIA